MKRVIAVLTLGLALAACSSGPTAYGPALDRDGMGFREQRIEDQRYRVSFRANPDMKAPEVENLALRRAADLTLQNGYQWFQVVSRMTDVVGGSQSGGGPTVGIGGGTGSYGSSLGIGLGFALGGDSRQFESTLEILMGRGVKPSDPSAY
ncbi:MAG: hypothetical protein B7Z44_19660, partial [Caulobacter sp. 12-67-6]